MVNLIFLLIFPFILLRISMRYHQLYRVDSKYRVKYKALFAEQIPTNRNSMLFNIIFIIRRYTIVLCLIAFPESMFT